MKIASQDFYQRSESAVQDKQLQAALALVSERFTQQRRTMVEQTEGWEGYRQQAEAIKEHSLQNLHGYLDQLENQVIANGGVVHRATDAAHACEIILAICRRHQIRLAVKGKSMVSEEIGLNHSLEKAGIEVMETDLGEFIIQLAGEPPFHIIVPAIHKTKQQVAELFHQHLGVPHSEDIAELTQIARRTLREKFLSAGLGISGANFAVAETGSIVIVENEGNARLSTTVPKVHIALMGMEKVIPKIADLGPFLTLLPRSATGQRFSSYVSWISGPRRMGDSDGPEHFYLIILDNGRSRILADPEMRSTLRCIRCGACLNHCPVYRHAGGHSYGWVYPGPIGSILTPQVVGLQQASPLPFASSLCGACAEVCPVRIDIPKILLTLRHRIIEKRAQGLLPRTLEGSMMWGWRMAMTRPHQRSLGIKVARFFQSLIAREGRLSRAPFPLSRWTRTRDFPAIAPQTFSEWWEVNRSKK